MGPTKHVFVIAEAGVNHNGSIQMAKQMIDVAVEAGADAVKFQTFNAKYLVTSNAPKAPYQVKEAGNCESQLSMLKKLELSASNHQILLDYTKKKGITFLSSPFDLESLSFITEKLELPVIKIPSGEITNGLFLLKVAQTNKDIILSTGMSTLAEIETALSVLAFGLLAGHSRPNMREFRKAYCSAEGQKLLKEKVTLLHCTTEYPAPFAEVNLNVIETLRIAFNLPVGLSDHTKGISVPIAAVALGATIIEKHFTLDHNLPGPDQKASLEPQELKSMVCSIREIEEAVGSFLKVPTVSEEKNAPVARKSLVAAKLINEGEVFSPENLTVKRPGNGISPMRLWEFYGKRAAKNYQIDELIEE